MPNENLEKLVQYARDKKPVAFKKLLHTEIGSRMSTKISDIKTNLSKTMFQTGKEEVELDEAGAYGNDRFLVKGNKAKLDNPKRGEKDGPNHVWAKNEKEALKKCKEEVELDEGKKLTSGGKKKAKKGSAVRVYTGDDVQLKDGVGTVIACQHKRDGPQRCLLKMLKKVGPGQSPDPARRDPSDYSGKEINTTVHPRQVIYSNVDNTVYSESVELGEGDEMELLKKYGDIIMKMWDKEGKSSDEIAKKLRLNSNDTKTLKDLMGESLEEKKVDHQLKIAIDTVKNPNKGKFLGGPSAKEAEKTLRTKYKYTDKMIAKLKEEVELDEALKPKDKKVIDAFYDRKKLEGKLLFTDGDQLEKLGMGRDTVAVWKGHKDGEGPRWGHRIVITSQSAVKSDDVILRYMKKSIPKLNFDPKSYKKYFGEEIEKTYKEHQFLNPLSPSSMYPLNEFKLEIEFGTDEGDRGFTKKRHNRLKVKNNVKVKTYDHKQTGQPVAMVSGTKQDVANWLHDWEYDIDDPLDSKYGGYPMLFKGKDAAVKGKGWK